MRIKAASGVLLLLSVVAALTASSPRKSQAPATEKAATAQEPTKSAPKASENSKRRKIPCKTSENAPQCYWMHGRLSVWEGNPPFRIWKIGTRRIVAVFSGPSHFPPRSERDGNFPEFPLSLDKAYDAYNRRMKQENGVIGAMPPPAFADFEVCPLEPEMAGEMRAVCIESAEKIVIPKNY